MLRREISVKAANSEKAENRRNQKKLEGSGNPVSREISPKNSFVWNASIPVLPY
jgi:hypothetical protein